MAAFSFLALMACGWAFVCCVIYAFSRYVGEQLPQAMKGYGVLALIMWVIFFAVIQGSADFHEDPLHPWRVTKGVGAAMICGFAIGSFLLCLNTRKRESWWHNVLLCAFYLGLAHIAGYALRISWPQTSGPLFEIARWNARPNDSHALMLFIWLFPLGAPLFELAFHSFRRLHNDNQTGSRV